MVLAQAVNTKQPATLAELLVAMGRGGERDWNRYYEFFSRVDWESNAVGLVAVSAILKYVQPCGVIQIAGDGSTWSRYGKQLAHAHYQHDPHFKGKGKRTIWAHSWVVLGLLVRVPWSKQRVCLPVLFKIVKASEKTEDGTVTVQAPSVSELANELLDLLVKAFPERSFEMVVDAGFTVKGFVKAGIVATTRIPSNAALHRVPPPRPDKPGPGRPPESIRFNPENLANDTSIPWQTARDGSKYKMADCTRPDSTGEHLCRVVIIRDIKDEQEFLAATGKLPADKDEELTADEKQLSKDKGKKLSYTIALLCTDPSHSPDQIRASYKLRWLIEVCFQQGKHVLFVGQQQSRLAHAVERAVPFGFLAQTLITVWFGLASEPEVCVARARAKRAWYNLKTDISLSDILTSLREESMAAGARKLAQESLAEELPETLLRLRDEAGSEQFGHLLSRAIARPHHNPPPTHPKRRPPPRRREPQPA
jgi:hypothetical protein